MLVAFRFRPVTGNEAFVLFWFRSLLKSYGFEDFSSLSTDGIFAVNKLVSVVAVSFVGVSGCRLAMSESAGLAMGSVDSLFTRLRSTSPLLDNGFLLVRSLSAVSFLFVLFNLFIVASNDEFSLVLFV